jgi:outer membrane cobalamin receptor
MTVKKRFLVSFLLVSPFVVAQNSSAIKLDEVVVTDVHLKNTSITQSVIQLNDSVLKKNQPLLTDLLNFNTPLYFKQYGRGMLATVSFRGTTASQTAVIWNGININSQLNGSTDFNTVTVNDYNAVNVKAGGGSIIYGSGAIGGTVHLNNDLVFKNQNSSTIQTSYGSFNTIGSQLNIKMATQKWSSQLGFSSTSSKNDYKYINRYDWKGKQLYNINGEYINTSFNASLGYKLTPKNQITFYSQTAYSDRNVSLIAPSETKTKYNNTFSRNLLVYKTKFNSVFINLKSAYLYENFNYFQDISIDSYSQSTSKSFISNLDLGFQISKSVSLNTIFDYNNTNGYGTSFGNNTRQIGSGALLLKYDTTKKWHNELGLRKEITNNYKSPFLFSLGSCYTFNSIYSLKFNFSKNFRIPTFNDLYWQGQDIGNPNLKPESSYQAEVGNVFNFKKFTLSNTLYYIKIKDLISWNPGVGGKWSPQNTNQVLSTGTETLLGYQNTFHKHTFAVNATYAYTLSQDQETGKQLFFVPFQKATATLNYSYKNWELDCQFLYNGFVYTRADNNPLQIIKAYKITNLGLSCNFKLIPFSKIGFQVLNLMNLKYQSLEGRPMPGRNFNMYINLKF